MKREAAESMGFTYADNISEAIAMALEREGRDASIGILTHGADMAPLVKSEISNKQGGIYE